MKGSPQQPDPGRPGLRIPIRVARPAAPEVQGHEGDDALPEGGADTVRRMKITKGMLEVYGYTDGCPRLHAPESESCGQQAANRAVPDAYPPGDHQ